MSRRAIARWALLVAVLGAAATGWILFQGRLNASAIETGIGELGAIAPLIFLIAFSVATVLFAPGSIFGLAGGVLFGPAWGAVWNLIGATLGAAFAFLISRFIAGDWIVAKLGARLKMILAGVEAEGWRFVALARLVPIVPFNALNYLLGLTKIPFLHYVVATFVCMAPGALAYAWLGYAGRAAVTGNGDALRYGLLGLAALAIVVFVPRLIRRIKQQSTGFMSVEELKRTVRTEQRPLIVDVRALDEFDGPLGHIDGAINIPMDLLPAAWEDRGACAPPVVVVCRTDKRSARAADILRAKGVDNVRVLQGGMVAWTKASPSSAALDTPS